MRRTFALLTLATVAALFVGCYSSPDRGSSSAPNTNTAPVSAAPSSQPVTSNSATVGGAAPQAKPSASNGGRIKPPTKN